VLPALLIEENPYWNPAALTFYGVVIAAVVAGPIAIMLQGRVKAQEAAAAAKRKREAEDAAAQRERDAADAKEDGENLAWLRGQVETLQGRVDAADRRDTDRQRQIGKLQGELRALREQLRERDADDRARDGRIAQLEGALRAAKISVPPAQADYLALLDREGRRRRPREE
jgi:predicted RNase H-like nuclease (RuvC/YqgF family)